jgi:LacI family transcriptional regulator
MAKAAFSLYPDYKKIWIFGMTFSSVDGQFRKGLVRYRGRTKKWLIRDIGYPLNDADWLRRETSTCDLLVGRIQAPEHVEFFASFGVPILDLSNRTQHPSIIRSHQLDYRAGGALAASYLRQLGYRNFAFITYSLPGSAVDLAWEGFSEEAAPAAASLHLIRRVEGKDIILKPDVKERPLSSVSAWLRQMERPMALTVFEERMAQEICQFALFSGVSIPEDLAVIGLHNDPVICETCLPSLTSIDFPGEYWGMQVGEHIDSIFNGKEECSQEQIPPAKVVARNSTALEVIEDPVVSRALALLRHHASGRLAIGEILRELPVSMRALQIRFRKAIGRSPLEELFRIRVEFARQQLLETDHTVERIAEDCGFRHAESMAQYFKKWTSLNPTQYRLKNRLRR